METRKSFNPGPVEPEYVLPRRLSWMRVKIRRQQVQLPPDWQHSFMEIDHEIFSLVILSLPLIQEGPLSVSGERMSTKLVNYLACPVKVW